MRQEESKQIFLLEDEALIRDVVTEYLVVAGYDVTTAVHGEDALMVLAENSFDLAILDIMVPGPSGLEVLAFIRSQQPELPVIMLSALGDEKSQIDAFNLFADDYVTKPFSPILLLKRITTILRRRSVKTASPMTGTKTELICKEDAYQAYYGSESLELTLSEFILLHTLMQRPQQVFTREQLIEAIYQGDYYGSDRVIDSHMKNLRKKLPGDYIRTVVGVGYQFDGSRP